MSFTNPTALFWATLAVPIVIFYLLKVRLRRVPVATTMFWEQVFEEKQPRAIWRQLRNVLSLLLQLLFLGLLVLAIGNPVAKNSVQRQRRVIVVLDNSASMQAIDTDGRRRFDVALDDVRQIITSLKHQDEMAIVLAGGRSAVACGLTSHPTTLLETLHGISATDGPTRLESSLPLARRLLAKHQHGEIIVVTDAALPSALSSDVVWSLIGNTIGNVAITELQVRRSPLDPLAYDILLEVSNFNDRQVGFTLDLELNDALLDVVPLELAAGESLQKVISRTSREGGILQASIAVQTANGSPLSDGLAADNIAYAILPAQRRIAVTLVTEGNWFLQHVLQANELIDLTIAQEIPQPIAADSVVVLHGSVPEKLPKGRIFVVEPDRSTDLWQLTGELQRPLVDKQQSDHNLLKFVRLDNAVMAEAKWLVPVADHETLVEAVSGSPLYLRFARPEGDVLVLTVNLERGDLPLRTAFPILFSNALTWFSGESADFIPAVRTGSHTRLQLPMNLATAPHAEVKLALTSPSLQSQTISQHGRAVVLPDLNEAGIWTLERSPSSDTIMPAAKSSGTMLIACNIADAAESDLRRTDAGPRADVESAGYGGSPLWLYAVIAAAVLLVLEWLLFHRRWIG
jgi:hypothetical protein